MKCPKCNDKLMKVACGSNIGKYYCWRCGKVYYETDLMKQKWIRFKNKVANWEVK